MFELAIKCNQTKFMSSCVVHSPSHAPRKYFGISVLGNPVFYNNTDEFDIELDDYNQIEHYIKTGEVLSLEKSVSTNNTIENNRDVLLELQTICKENAIDIHVHRDEIVVNLANDNTEYVVTNMVDLDKLLATKKEMDRFARISTI